MIGILMTVTTHRKQVMCALYGIAAFCLVFFPSIAVATSHAPYVPLANIPGLTADHTSLGDYLNLLFRVLITAGALLAVIKIALAGVQYMTAESSFGSTQKAKETIWNALLGLLLILSVVVILQVINPNILNLNILAGRGYPGITIPPSSLGVSGTPGVPVTPGGARDEIRAAIEECESRGGEPHLFPGGVVECRDPGTEPELVPGSSIYTTISLSMPGVEADLVENTGPLRDAFVQGKIIGMVEIDFLNPPTEAEADAECMRLGGAYFLSGGGAFSGATRHYCVEE